MDDVDSSGVGYLSSAVIGLKEDTQVEHRFIKESFYCIPSFQSSSEALLPSPEVNSFRDDLNKQASGPINLSSCLCFSNCYIYCLL